jgi:hypothetical protein
LGAIVLLKERGPGAYWYSSIHFGTTAHTAILENWRLDGSAAEWRAALLA